MSQSQPLELDSNGSELHFKDRIVNQPYIRVGQARKLPIATHTKKTSDIDGFVVHQRGCPLGPNGNMGITAKKELGENLPFLGLRGSFLNLR